MAEERLGIATAEQSRERAMPSIEQNTSPEPRAMQRSPEGEWSWHPEHVKVGEVVLGPTYRFMKLDTFIESDGVRIFVDCASGARLCKHGELGTSIQTWRHLEAAAEREGKPPPSRPSICDCVSTCGLNKRATPCAEEIPEQTLYEHLVQLGTPRIVVEGREARQLPFTSGECASFLRGVDGRIVCRHGRLRASLMHMRAAGNRARCSCMPSNFPTRLATRELTAPEKRNSAEKRKRASAYEMRTTPVCEPASPTALVEPMTDTSSDDGDAATLGPQVLTEDVAMDAGKTEGGL